ncbi:serine/threonine-protein kinase [Nocardia salmonicida]|uniref:serine/threonine-protein kinase n=1 Tax=Nocardia salmonicida TaxID=53431 RepID=UPI0036312FBB
MSSGRVVIDQRFELIEPLGKGGMGTVWRAYDVALHREVALKEVRDLDESGADPGIHRERVLREARALARIAHPNVVAVHHIVDSDQYDHPWIVMELVRGRALSDVLVAGSLPPSQVAELGRGILGALRAAHSVGVLHRDVKPANVIVRDDGSPVLTDFGIAAIHGMTALTSTGSVVGSLDYVAPERLQGIEGNPASDLWSLGLVLYYAVEGHQPMRRESSVATLAAVIGGQVPTPQRAGPLSGVLGALLVTDPARRPDPAQLDFMLAEAAGRNALGQSGPYFAVRPPTSGQHRIVGPPHQSGSHSAVPSPIHSDPRFPTPPMAFATPQPGSSQPNHLATWPEPAASVMSGQPTTGWPTPASPVPSSAGGVMFREHTPTARRWGIFAAAGAVAAVVALTAALLLRPDSAVSAVGTSPIAPTPFAAPLSTTPGSRPSTAPIASLHDPKNLRAALTALESATGGIQFTRTTIYPTFISTGAPVAARPSVYDEFTFRDGRATRTGPGGDLSEPTVALGIFNWDAVPELFRVAERDLGVPAPTARYLIIEPAWTFNDDRPTLLVYVSDDYGGGYLAADTDGTITDKVPR